MALYYPRILGCQWVAPSYGRKLVIFIKLGDKRRYQDVYKQ